MIAMAVGETWKGRPKGRPFSFHSAFASLSFDPSLANESKRERMHFMRHAVVTNPARLSTSVFS